MPASTEGRPRLLILGGTTEAALLAKRLVAEGRWDVVTSLAGATRRRRALAGEVRTGGFGGTEGLVDYLEAARIARVIDATHPYAAMISRHAAAACARLGLPALRLQRPPWQRQSGDRWIEVADTKEAAKVLPGLAKRAFLSIGRREIAAFTGLPEVWFLVRLIEAPDEPLGLATYELLLARGPFEVASERALLDRNRIAAVVAKNSGGDATYAKIEAAREAAVPVVMIARPEAPEGIATAAGVEDVLAWLAGA
ncbi:MAG: cobalt-precorrin-6A reductase [Alphaproteobacteria bacterium]|nr:cobalt-precorrin-6A reductase [Alphaproteobacteria bacterium]